MGEALAAFVVAGRTFVLFAIVQVAEAEIEFH
jgi:hypothetical protein